MIKGGQFIHGATRVLRTWARLAALIAVGGVLGPTTPLGSVLGQAALGQSVAPAARRAKLPDWQSKRGTDVFFEDPFSEALRGTRPAALGRAAAAPSPRTTSAAPALVSPADSEPFSAASGRWSRWIRPSTLEDEIKRIEQVARNAVQSEGHFRGGGFREVRVQFGVGAVLFAIIQDYDEPAVRWQSDAGTLWQTLARSATNSRVGSPQSFKEAKLRSQELFDLIRGGQVPPQPARELAWPEIADRSILMARLEQAVQGPLASGVASQLEFERQGERVVHEAELVAAIGHVLHRPGMDDAVDDEYIEFCESMKSAARELVSATERANYKDARSAHGRLKTSCADCHEQYR